MSSIEADIKDAMTQLSARDDLLSDRIKLIEEMFRRCINIRIGISIDEGAELVFGKHGGEWHLLVVYPVDKICVLTSCSREVRMNVFLKGYLNTLIDSVVAKTHEQIALRDEALRKSEAFIARLEKL